MHHTSIKLALPIFSVFALFIFGSSQAATKSDAVPVIKPMPPSMLKKLTITFNADGKPIFSPKKNIKAIQCDPATAHSGNGKHADLPPCGAAGYASTTSSVATAPSPKSAVTAASAQTMDTNCYTIYWEQGGVIYSYTYCWDTTSGQ